MTNCVFNNQGDSGLKIQMNEGAEIKDLIFTHLSMTNVPRPLFLTLCQKNAWYGAPSNQLLPAGSVSNLHFKDITVNDQGGSKNSGFIIIGMPGHPVENLSFQNIRALLPGGGTAADATNVVAELTPENLGNRWPEARNLRVTIPAYGFFAHHVEGLSLNDASFETRNPEGRPALDFNDVSGIDTNHIASNP